MKDERKHRADRGNRKKIGTVATWGVEAGVFAGSILDPLTPPGRQEKKGRGPEILLK